MNKKTANNRKAEPAHNLQNIEKANAIKFCCAVDGRQLLVESKIRINRNPVHSDYAARSTYI